MNGAFLSAFDALPLGASEGRYNGRRYLIIRETYAAGAAEKLVARALDGSDYISLNLYRLNRETLLKPCEMPEEKVVRFVLGVEGAHQSA